MLERLIATVKFFFAKKDDAQALEDVLAEVRASPAFSTFEEAAAALQAVDVQSLGTADDDAKHAFWINAQNLTVLHACANRASRSAPGLQS